MLRQLRTLIVTFGLLTVLTGVAYPLLITGIAMVGFSRQAGGSLIERDGGSVGSELLGQPFSSPKYFWSRLSATSPQPYNGMASAGSNQGARNPALADAVSARVKALRDADPGNAAPVPVDLVTASGSGLDPHISIAAAAYQAPRVARVRRISVDQVMTLVGAHAEGRTFGLIGEPRVNVLELNLALDRAR